MNQTQKTFVLDGQQNKKFECDQVSLAKEDDHSDFGGKSLLSLIKTQNNFHPNKEAYVDGNLISGDSETDQNQRLVQDEPILTSHQEKLILAQKPSNIFRKSRSKNDRYLDEFDYVQNKYHLSHYQGVNNRTKKKVSDGIPQKFLTQRDRKYNYSLNGQWSGQDSSNISARYGGKNKLHLNLTESERVFRQMHKSMYEDILRNKPYSRTNIHEMQTKEGSELMKKIDQNSSMMKTSKDKRRNKRRNKIQSNFFTTKTILKAQQQYKKTLSNMNEENFEEQWLSSINLREHDPIKMKIKNLTQGNFKGFSSNQLKKKVTANLVKATPKQFFEMEQSFDLNNLTSSKRKNRRQYKKKKSNTLHEMLKLDIKRHQSLGAKISKFSSQSRSRSQKRSIEKSQKNKYFNNTKDVSTFDKSNKSLDCSFDINELHHNIKRTRIQTSPNWKIPQIGHKYFQYNKSSKSIKPKSSSISGNHGFKQLGNSLKMSNFDLMSDSVNYYSRYNKRRRPTNAHVRNVATKSKASPTLKIKRKMRSIDNHLRRQQGELLEVSLEQKIIEDYGPLYTQQNFISPDNSMLMNQLNGSDDQVLLTLGDEISPGSISQNWNKSKSKSKFFNSKSRGIDIDTSFKSMDERPKHIFESPCFGTKSRNNDKKRSGVITNQSDTESSHTFYTPNTRNYLRKNVFLELMKDAKKQRVENKQSRLRLNSQLSQNSEY